MGRSRLKFAISSDWIYIEETGSIALVKMIVRIFFFFLETGRKMCKKKLCDGKINVELRNEIRNNFKDTPLLLKIKLSTFSVATKEKFVIGRKKFYVLDDCPAQSRIFMPKYYSY